MINLFKVGDEVTIHPMDVAASISARDTTQGKRYTLTAVAEATRAPVEAQSIEFIDDVGSLVTIGCEDIQLADE